MQKLILLALTVVTTIACGRDAKEGAAKVATDSSATGAMPGMKMPGDSAGTAAGLPDQVTFTAEQVRHGGVAWEPATTGLAPSIAIVPGTLTPNEDRTARLGAPSEGRVIDVRVQPGDHVTEGQLLATLQSRDAAMAQSDVTKAAAEVTSRRAAAQYATAARNRAERLLTLKAIPRQEFERAIADDEEAKASLAQAEAELQRARSAAEQLGATGSSSGVVSLRSPRAGVVLTREAVPGTVIAAGAPVVTITDPASLWLRVNAPEQLASRFRVGDALRFTVPAAGGDSFAARIEAVSPALDAETRTLAVRGLVGAGAHLKAEMLASVEVAAGPGVSAVILPEDAVQVVKGVPTVFTVMPMPKDETMFYRRPVQVGSRSGGKIAVTGGLKAGEIIVTRGAFAVRAQFEKGLMPKMVM